MPHNGCPISAHSAESSSSQSHNVTCHIGQVAFNKIDAPPCPAVRQAQNNVSVKFPFLPTEDIDSGSRCQNLARLPRPCLLDGTPFFASTFSMPPGSVAAVPVGFPSSAPCSSCQEFLSVLQSNCQLAFCDRKSIGKIQGPTRVACRLGARKASKSGCCPVVVCSRRPNCSPSLTLFGPRIGSQQKHIRNSELTHMLCHMLALACVLYHIICP